MVSVHYRLTSHVVLCKPARISYWTVCIFMPPPRRGGIKRWSASVVRLSVCLMSRTSALTRKPKGLGRRNFAQGYHRSHATPTPTSRSKGQKSRWGGGILWRRPSRTACYVQHVIKVKMAAICHISLFDLFGESWEFMQWLLRSPN